MRRRKGQRSGVMLMKRSFTTGLIMHFFVLTISLAAHARDNRPPRHFRALWNGKNLNGWQGLVELPQRMKLAPEALARVQKEADEKVLPHWTAQNGVLHYDGKGNSLQPAQSPGDPSTSRPSAPAIRNSPSANSLCTAADRRTLPPTKP